MPLQKLQFRPGINRESTTLTNEGGWFASDKIRFRSGSVEKIGGWLRDSGTIATTAPTGTFVSGGTSTSTPITGGAAFWGVVRSLINWVNLNSSNLLGVGTSLKYYIQNSINGAFNDVTPIRSTTAAGAVTFAATNLSTTITVTNTSHGAQTNDFVVFTGAVSLGGNITATILNREYQITFVNNNVYTITSSVAANSSDSGNGGGSTIGNYQLNTGNSSYTVGTGWGAGGWGGSTGPLASTTLTANITSTSTAAIAVVSTTGFNNGAASLATSTISSAGILTVGTLSSGTIYIGMVLTGSGVPAGTYIVSNISGTGTGSTWQTNITTAVSSTTITGGGGVIFLNSAGSGSSSTYANAETVTYTSVTATTFAGTITRSVDNTPVVAHSTGDAVLQFSSTATGWGVASASTASSGTTSGTAIRLWSQSNYGEDLIINPRGGAMYYWANNANNNLYDRAQTLGAGSTVSTKNGPFTPDSTCPSVANMILVSDSSRFLFAFGCNDPTGVYATTAQDPLQIRWSDQGQAGVWTPAITNQAGGIKLSKGSTIVTYLQTRQEILVWTDASLYSLQYLGSPYVWGSQLLGDNLSIASPNAVTTANNMVFWMGADKFYMYSGRVETLPSAVRQYVYDNINLSQAYQITCGSNKAYNEVWWFYPSSTGTNPDGSNINGGTLNTIIDRYVIYNYIENTWYYGTFNGIGDSYYSAVRPRTSWIDSPLRQAPTAGPIAGISYVNSGTPYSYTNGAIVYHEVPQTPDNNETGTAVAIAAFCESSDFDIGDGHNYGFVWRVIPDITFDGSTSATPNVNFTVKPRQNPGSAYGTSDNPFVISGNNYTTAPYYTVQLFTQIVYVRARGRQMAFRIESNNIPGTTTSLGTAWQLGTPRIDVRPDGRR
jgi:hypothetical protein